MTGEEGGGRRGDRLYDGFNRAGATSNWDRTVEKGFCREGKKKGLRPAEGKKKVGIEGEGKTSLGARGPS